MTLKNTIIGSLVLAILVVGIIVTWLWIYPLKPKFQLDAKSTSLSFTLSDDWELNQSIALVGDDVRLYGNLISVDTGNTHVDKLSRLWFSFGKQASDTGKIYLKNLNIPTGSIVTLYSSSVMRFAMEILLPPQSPVTGDFKIKGSSQLCTEMSQINRDASGAISNSQSDTCITLPNTDISNIVEFSATGNLLKISAKAAKPFNMDNFSIAQLSFGRRISSKVGEVKFKCGLESGVLFVTDIYEERKLYKQTCLKLSRADAISNVTWDNGIARVTVVGQAVISPTQLLPSAFYYFWKQPRVIFYTEIFVGFITLFITIWGFLFTLNGVFKK